MFHPPPGIPTPPVLDDALIARVESAATEGLSVEDIAGLCDVPLSSFRSWLAKGDAEDERLADLLGDIDRALGMDDRAMADALKARLLTPLRDVPYLKVRRAVARGRAKFAQEILRNVKASARDRNPDAALRILGKISPVYAAEAHAGAGHTINFNGGGPTQVLVGKDERDQAEADKTFSALTTEDLQEAAHDLARRAMGRKRDKREGT